MLNTLCYTKCCLKVAIKMLVYAEKRQHSVKISTPTLEKGKLFSPPNKYSLDDTILRKDQLYIDVIVV